MKFKKILTVLAALTFTASFAAPYDTGAVPEAVSAAVAEPTSQPVTGNDSGSYDGYSYSAWSDNNDVSMKLGNSGTFSCEWQDAEQAVFSRGVSNVVTFHDHESVEINAQASVQCSTPYFISESFIYHDQNNFEEDLFIIMAYSGLDFLSEREPAAENDRFMIYSFNYNIFDDSDEICKKQVFMLYKDGENKHDINISKDVTNDLRILCEFIGDKNFVVSDPMLCLYGFNGSGKADVTKNEITVKSYGKSDVFTDNTEYVRGGYTYSLSKSKDASGAMSIDDRGYCKLEWNSKSDEDQAMIKKTFDLDGLFKSYVNEEYSIYSVTQIKTTSAYAVGSYWRTKNNDEIYVASFKNILTEFADKSPVAVIPDRFSGDDRYNVYVVDELTPYGTVSKQYWLVNVLEFKDKAYQGVSFDDIAYFASCLKKHGITVEDIVEGGIFAKYCGKGSGEMLIRNISTKFSQKYRGEHVPSDIEVLQKYLLGERVRLDPNVNYDMNHDDVIDIYDLIEMRKFATQGNESPSGINGLREIDGVPFPRT